MVVSSPRTLSFIAVAVLVSAGPAFAARGSDLPGYNGLRAADGTPLRQARTVGWAVPVGAIEAWQRLEDHLGPQWQAQWDASTGVPLRAFGPGLLVPGSVHDGVAAEDAARALLAEHLDLWAPGAAIEDFVLLHDHLAAGRRLIAVPGAVLPPGGVSGGAGGAAGFITVADAGSAIRTVSFAQQRDGVAVLGGNVSFRFKHDRLFVVASEALPFAPAPALSQATIDAATAAVIAEDWIAGDYGSRTRSLGVGDVALLPLVAAPGDAVEALRFATVVPVTLDAQGPVGRWVVYLDAASGEPVARRQTLMFATGQVRFNTPERWPGATRNDVPAAHAYVTSGTSNGATDPTGAVGWTGTTSIPLSLYAQGEGVVVGNNAGAEATLATTIAPDGQAVWDARNDPPVDAQLITYLGTQAAIDRSRIIAPDMGFLDSQVQANVNIADVCNAYSDGVTTNFFLAGSGCENTGRLPDVIYHEFGHSFHVQAMLGPPESFDVALSEGGADFFSSTVTGDPGMGRGFFGTADPLRHIDAENRVWPTDVVPDEPHTTGLIYSGAMWDLRKALIDLVGQNAALPYMDYLYYEVFRRAVDIPSSYVEVLAADDDDGDLTNGSPYACAINDAFGLHGLAEPAAVSAALPPPTRDERAVTLAAGAGAGTCAALVVSSAQLRWSINGGSAGQVAMTATPSGFWGELPSVARGLVNYQVVAALGDGTSRTFPDNPADPWYQAWFGETEVINCNGFESDPMAEGWSHTLLAGASAEGADDWQWGTPGGVAGSGDPAQAVSGDSAVGNDLGGAQFNGLYQAEKTNALSMPAIDVTGFVEVRLHYRRWLTVEDGLYDHASIYANDEVVWRNTAGDGNLHHIDREWREHDLDLTAQAASGSLTVRFELASDNGVELGGWTIDNLCVLGRRPPVDPPDDDPPGDDPPSTDPGNDDPGSDGTVDIPQLAGCAQTGADAGLWAGLLALLALGLRRRR